MSRPGLKESWDQLASAQKSGAGVPFYMRAINRRFGRGLAVLGARWGATPNQATAASAVAALVGLGLVACMEPSVGMAVAATFLMQLAFALDSADGQLARLTGKGSGAGEWLDHVVDCARTVLFHAAIGISLYRFADVGGAVLLVPLAFGFAAVVRFFALILAEQLRRAKSSDTPESGSAATALIQTPADVGVQNFVLLLLPWTTVFVAAYGVLAAANMGLLAISLRRRYGQLVG